MYNVSGCHAILMTSECWVLEPPVQVYDDDDDDDDDDDKSGFSNTSTSSSIITSESSSALIGFPS